jgi:hypothetical protein
LQRATSLSTAPRSPHQADSSRAARSARSIVLTIAASPLRWAESSAAFSRLGIFYIITRRHTFHFHEPIKEFRNEFRAAGSEAVPYLAPTADGEIAEVEGLKSRA